MAKRRYEQRLRAETAEETRRRILDAVYERLREAPSQPVSVDRIARMAGVARSTVYLVFGSRAGLFDALGDDLLRRDAYERLLEAVAHPDARESLRRGMRAGCEMFAGRPRRRPGPLLDGAAGRGGGGRRGAAVRGGADARAWRASRAGSPSRTSCFPASRPARPPTCSGS